MQAISTRIKRGICNETKKVLVVVKLERPLSWRPSKKFRHHTTRMSTVITICTVVHPMGWIPPLLAGITVEFIRFIFSRNWNMGQCERIDMASMPNFMW